MLRAMVRTGVILGSVSAAVYLARRFFASDFDKAVDTAKTTFKDITGDLKRKETAVTSSIEDSARRAI